MLPSDKIKKVMHEFKQGTLHQGRSKKIVKNKKQALAIALSQARKMKNETVEDFNLHQMLEAKSLSPEQIRAIFSKNRSGSMRRVMGGVFVGSKGKVMVQPEYDKHMEHSGREAKISKLLGMPGSDLRQRIAKVVREARKSKARVIAGEIVGEPPSNTKKVHVWLGKKMRF